MQPALDMLHATFGFSAFRGRQEDVVARVLAGQSTLAVMPTGAGKSLTYQLPSVMLPGTCVVISPLIALMHDQLRSAEANGIRAATLTSADMNREQTIDRFRAGELDLLYAAPERASQGHFRELLASSPISLFAESTTPNGIARPTISAAKLAILSLTLTRPPYAADSVGACISRPADMTFARGTSRVKSAT